MENSDRPHSSTPPASGYTMPAEWAPHRACYTAWPAHEYAWGAGLAAAQREFIGFAHAFAGAQQDEQEPLTVLVMQEHLADAQRALGDLQPRVQLQVFDYGDVWLRDTGPLFLRGHGGLASARFRFNGWGAKYEYPHDKSIAKRLTALRELSGFAYDFVLEGGAIDLDGAGTCLTTRSCLQNPNRGEPVSDARWTERLHTALGVDHIVWLDAGLANDHTDGHVDNIARFVAEGVVVCMQAHDADDPNADTLDVITRMLQGARSARGQALKVVRIPSPGRVLGSDGQVVPASYMNFYIGNRRVVLPSFGSRWDEPAREALQALFPGREVVSSSARAILEGGGTFHCMTQQEPWP